MTQNIDLQHNRIYQLLNHSAFHQHKISWHGYHKNTNMFITRKNWTYHLLQHAMASLSPKLYKYTPKINTKTAMLLDTSYNHSSAESHRLKICCIHPQTKNTQMKQWSCIRRHFKVCLLLTMDRIGSIMRVNMLHYVMTCFGWPSQHQAQVHLHVRAHLHIRQDNTA